MTAARILAAALAALAPSVAAQEIRNPYFSETKWRVWRDDATPVENVRSLLREGKQNKPVTITLAPIAPGERRFPLAGRGDRFLDYRQGPARRSGVWDDVYASWSGLHGYVRTAWKGADGNAASVRDQIIHFAGVNRRDMLRAGVNFVHQSTTGMGHTITNGYSPRVTERFEKYYFADLLVCAPAHLSWTDLKPERSDDLYLAMVPTLFNSVGSSNSETMAITKMILAGGYLPPATKLLLKRNGLYPSAMLYIWKAALPYDVPYDHELRHRLAYKAVGDRTRYPGGYSAAGINKGDCALAFHRYDDTAHMRNMIDIAKAMRVAPPEAILKTLSVTGGTKRYALEKSLLVLQSEGDEVRIRVSTEDSYDLQGRPVAVRWRLFHGNRRTRVEREGDTAVWTITVPSNDALPEGRTCIGLFANNGVSDGNPAIVTVYRQKADALPPNGAGYQDYKYPGTHTNRRPIVLDLQDVVVRRGQTARVPLHAADPEGFPVAFYKRSTDVGKLEQQSLVWRCPRKQAGGPQRVSVIVSDGTSGNSYGGKTITLHVGRPAVHAHITPAGKLTGPAPLTVTVSAQGSFARKGKLRYGWDFYRPALGRKRKKLAELAKGKKATHTFTKPGVYEIALTVASAAGTDTETVGVLVLPPKRR